MNKNDEIKHIGQFIDRFMQGTSTLAEEAELSSYFATHKVPPEWADFKAMMAYFDEGMPDIDAQPAATKAALLEPQPKKRATVVPLRRTMWWAAAAAVAAITVTATLHFANPGSREEPQAPIVASTIKPSPAPEAEEATPQLDVTVKSATNSAQKAVRRHPMVKPATAPLNDSVAVAKAEGQMELYNMMAQADYEQWQAQVMQTQATDRAMMLIEQGAAKAMQDSANGNDELAELH